MKWRRGLERALVIATVCAAHAVRADIADVPQVFATTDEAAVRFSSPDTGGPAHPRFISRRQLSFEARLVALEEDPSGALQARHVRAAVDSHVADQMLASLPLEQQPTPATVASVSELLRARAEQHLGRQAIEHAMRIDRIDASELGALIRTQALAVLYLDHIKPILTVTEDELRETYRTTSHPFRSRRFDDCHDDLARWLVVERFHSAEQAYLQAARSRVAITYL
jgi:hypothetical protein